MGIRKFWNRNKEVILEGSVKDLCWIGATLAFTGATISCIFVLNKLGVRRE